MGLFASLPLAVFVACLGIVICFGAIAGEVFTEARFLKRHSVTLANAGLGLCAMSLAAMMLAQALSRLAIL